MKFKIVDATEKDIEILNTIKSLTMITDSMDKQLSFEDKEKIKKNINKNIRENFESYKMIYDNTKLVGVYLLIPYLNSFMLDEFYIMTDYQHKGYGKEILKSIVDNNSHLYAWSYKENEYLIKLLKEFNFNEYKIKDNLIIFMYDEIYTKLNQELRDVKFGYVDKKGNKHLEIDKEFKDIYYLQSPEELKDSKVGLSFDLVEFERNFVYKRNIKHQTYFMLYPSNDTSLSHSFLVYKVGDKYYWYEYSWLKFRGLHEYKRLEELYIDVLKKFTKLVKDGKYSKVKLYEYNKPKHGINYTKFLSNSINTRSTKVK